MKDRLVIPELLDSLDPSDPGAIRSRKDLSRINAVMGNYQWIRSRIEAAHATGVETWMELGSGDGPLAKLIPNSLATKIKLTGVDFAPRPSGWPGVWDWAQGDLFETLDSDPGVDTSKGLIANLFLHHFEVRDLKRIGERIESGFSRLVISEPARYERFRRLGYLAFPLINEVTRNDMIISIGAGFRPGELPELLGLQKAIWDWTESVTLMGAYRLEAHRKE